MPTPTSVAVFNPTASQAIDRNLDEKIISEVAPCIGTPRKLRGKGNRGFDKDIFESSILVIDANADSALHVKKILMSSGFKNVHSETKPRQVVKHIRKLRPDLIALELHMPEISGLEIMGVLASTKKNFTTARY